MLVKNLAGSKYVKCYLIIKLIMWITPCIFCHDKICD